GQVAVLPVGASETLVEPAQLLEHRPSVGHVGGDPTGTGQPGHVAFPVGGGSIGRQRHVDPSLHAGHVGLAPVQVRNEGGKPVGGGEHIVVEEHHPIRRGGPPSVVAGGRRTLPALRFDHLHLTSVEVQGSWTPIPVVD